MMLWLEEFGVETAMIVATVTAAAVFFWATGSMLVGWVRYSRAVRLTPDEAPFRTAQPTVHPTQVAGPSA